MTFNRGLPENPFREVQPTGRKVSYRKVKAGEEGEEGPEHIYSFPAGGSKIKNLLTSGNRLLTKFLNGISDSGDRRTEVRESTADSTQGKLLLASFEAPEASTKASPPQHYLHQPLE
ncbi:hypothetical protein SESBI_13321 [Sesbania bispinosa]|nr:hypothetical protein SESBI_13321 [Sesbania bispinosa]